MSLKYKLLIIAILILLPLGWITSCTITNNRALASSQLITGYLTNNHIDEASGIAVSHLNKDVIWINNDSGSDAALYAVSTQGKYLATLTLLGIKNHDWEDLSILNYKGDNYIVIADTGDNDSEGTNYQLHFIKEPILNINNSNQQELITTTEWTVNFAYQDTPRDVEAVAVDPINEKILLLNKRELPHQLFTLPLKQKKDIPLMMATLIGEIPAFPNPLKLRLGIFDILNYSNMPTSMDISPDGSMAVILTYSSAYLYLKKTQDSWLETFAKKPKQINFPTLKQAEAIAFDPSGKYLYITSERTPTPILKINLNEYKK
jgi:hypothetical protein